MARQRPLARSLSVLHAIYVVPGCTILLTAALLLHGRVRSGPAARIYGGPPGPDSIAAWRVCAVDRAVGVELPIRHSPIAVVLHIGSRRIALDAVTDDEGAAEVRIPLGSPAESAQVEVLLAGPEPRMLCAGRVPLSVPAWAASQHADPLPIPGSAEGSLAVSVSPMRGSFAAPYPDKVSIRVIDPTSLLPVSGVAVSIKGQGMAWDGPPSATTDDQGRVRLGLRPLDHEVRLEVLATAPGRQGRWTGLLPVVPGALWLDPRGAADGRLRISSPVGHRFAYVTTVDRSSRLHATRIPLTPDEGGAFGEASIPTPPRGAWLLLSPDPPGRETPSVAWPVLAPDSADPRPSLRMRTPLLVDGMPMAERLMKRQSLRTRVRALSVLGLGALLEAALMWLRARQLQDEVDRALAAMPDAEPDLAVTMRGGKGFWLRMVVACALAGLAFFAVALVTWLGTGG